MTQPRDPHNLSKRERQIMNIVYEMGKATAMDILERLPNPPSYSAVRGMVRVLEEKGHLSHTQKSKRNVYHPTLQVEKAGHSAMLNLVKTFFGGSPERAVTALIDLTKEQLSEEALARLSEAIEQAKEEGR